jgi:1-phosphofructokinase
VIYTVTLNPALDYIIKMDELKKGEINRSKEEITIPGGKGINVSIVLKELGIDSVALGWVSGFVGEEIEKRVKQHGIVTDFIKLKNSESRINVKIVTSEQETAINCIGQKVNEDDINKLYEKIEKIGNGKEMDWIVLAGSVPKGVNEEIYEKICEILKQKNVKIIVDTTREFLLNTLKYKPFLIKPNKDELEEIFNIKINSKDEAIKYAKILKENGAQNVLVSLGGDGAILVDENNEEHKIDAIKNKEKISTVGAGDSVIAGFVAGYLKYENYEKALKMGMAAGGATANSIFLATKEEILKLFGKE